MGGFFKIDGPFYKFGNILYYLMVANLLWVIFSIPVLTMGASTTALFHVMGKVVRDDDISVFKDFWKSFRMNFKQATLVWLIIAVAFGIVITNIMNIGLLGNMAKYMLPVQYAIIIEFTIVTVYIFPMLSRYEMTTRNLIKTAFFLGNRHILHTILCFGSLAAVFLLLSRIPGLFILIFMSLYALAVYYIIHRLFVKYMPGERKDEPSEEDER